MEEFKAEAIKQITERGHKAVDVAQQLYVSDKSLYLWPRQTSGKQSAASSDNVAGLEAEMACPKVEVRRIKEERDILKKTAAGSTGHRTTWVNLSLGVM